MAEAQTSKLDYLTHHEAAHAAVALSFGLHVERVWINQAQDDGWMKLTDESLKRLTDLQHVLIALAGPRAERHLDVSGVTTRCSAVLDWDKARYTIEMCLRSRFEGHSDPQIGKMLDHAEALLALRCGRMVEEQWPAIQRLAAVLVEKPDITGKVAEAALTGEAN